MTEPATPTEPTPDATATWHRLARVLRGAAVLLAVVFFGPAWCCAAVASLVWHGLRAGWCDMREWTGFPDKDETQRSVE